MIHNFRFDNIIQITQKLKSGFVFYSIKEKTFYTWVFLLYLRGLS